MNTLTEGAQSSANNNHPASFDMGESESDDEKMEGQEVDGMRLEKGRDGSGVEWC